MEVTRDSEDVLKQADWATTAYGSLMAIFYGTLRFAVEDGTALQAHEMLDALIRNVAELDAVVVDAGIEDPDGIEIPPPPEPSEQ